jgi:hypothetical protein
LRNRASLTADSVGAIRAYRFPATGAGGGFLGLLGSLTALTSMQSLQTVMERLIRARGDR